VALRGTGFESLLAFLFFQNDEAADELKHGTRYPVEKVLLMREIHRQVDPESDQRAFAARIARMERAGKFPARVRIGMRRIGWRESELLAWFDSLERGMRKEPERGIRRAPKRGPGRRGAGRVSA
jgi:hypothetical protein